MKCHYLLLGQHCYNAPQVVLHIAHLPLTGCGVSQLAVGGVPNQYGLGKQGQGCNPFAAVVADNGSRSGAMSMKMEIKVSQVIYPGRVNPPGRLSWWRSWLLGHVAWVGHC